MSDTLQTLRDATALTAQVAERFDAWIKANQGADLNEVLRIFYLMRDEYDNLDEERKKIGALIEQMSRGVIPDAMMRHDTKTITIASLGRRFTVSAKLSASIIDKPGAYLWLRDPKQDAGDLIQETVNASSLSKYAKEYTNDKGLDLPPELFKVSTMSFTSVTKI